MSKHTPGPWEATTDIHGCPSVRNFDGFGVCSTYGKYESPEQKEANANLIAAAPDMLEALKALDEAEFQGMFTEGQWTKEHQELFENAHAAIAKAEGNNE